MSGYIEPLIWMSSLGFRRYWRCDKTYASVNICSLSGTESDIHKLTSAIKPLPQTATAGFRYWIKDFTKHLFVRACLLISCFSPCVHFGQTYFLSSQNSEWVARPLTNLIYTAVLLMIWMRNSVTFLLLLLCVKLCCKPDKRLSGRKGQAYECGDPITVFQESKQCQWIQTEGDGNCHSQMCSWIILIFERSNAS